MKRNRFSMSGVLLIVAATVFFAALACPADAAPRRRIVTTEPDTAKYLQYACWTHDSLGERIERVSAFIAAHRLESGVVTPPMVLADEDARRTAPIFVYMRREMWCEPREPLTSQFTRDEARQMWEVSVFLVRVSFYLDGIFGHNQW